jgi:hypothetical protein
VTQPIQSPSWIEWSYGRVIRLYPVAFYECHGEAMKQSLRDAVADSELRRDNLLRILLKDLIQSLIKENFAMSIETFSRPALLYNALVLGALCTALSLGFLVIEQQSLRQTANDPQLGMATDLARHLAHGVSVASAVPNNETDMDASLSPFVIAYDEQGRVLASSAQLNGTVPPLPHSLFDFVRQHGEDRVTWAPRRGVRIASVIRHVDGPKGGFVLAGRNLRETESRKDLLMKMAALVWLGLLGIIFAGTLLYGWLARRPSTVLA